MEKNSRLERLLLIGSNEERVLKLVEKFPNLRAKTIIYEGGFALMVYNGMEEFLCTVDTREKVIRQHHLSRKMNRKGKIKFHSHDRVFYDWRFCLKSLNDSHVNYK